MPSLLRVFETWFALLLTIGQVTRIIVEAVSSVSTSATLVVGSFVTFCTTIGLLRWDPDLNVGRLWRIGFTAFAIGIVIGVAGMFGSWVANIRFTTYEQYVYPLAVGLAILIEPVYQSGGLTQNTILGRLRGE